MAPPAGAPPTPAADVGDAQHALGRFGLSMTPSMRELLQEVAASPGSPDELKQLCSQHAAADTVPWKLVQLCCACVRQQQQQQQPATSSADAAATDDPQPHRLSAQQVCAGSRIVLASPPARQRSKQLRARLAELQERLDAKAYAGMVADVAGDEQAAAEAAAAGGGDALLPTTRLQLSFGLHVIVTMGTFFALAYYAARFAFPHNAAWAALAGALGLLAGLLLETTLLIVRTNMPAPLDKRYAHLVAKDWDAKQQQQQREQQASNGGAKSRSGGGKAAPGGAHAGSGQQKQQQMLRRRAAGRQA